MRKSKQIIATAVMAALLLSGCAQENKGASEAGNNTQQTPSVSSTAQIADSSAEMIEDGNSGLTTLAETVADYNGCSLLYPNFEELSVGVLYKDDDNKYCLMRMEMFDMFRMVGSLLRQAFMMECASRTLG